MKTFDKLKRRIKKDLDLDVERFERTYAGGHMQSSGAHKWKCFYEGSSISIGSSFTATELIKHKGKLILTNGYSAGDGFSTDREIEPDTFKPLS